MVTENKIRVIMVDDHAMFTESVSRILAGTPDIEIVGLATSMESAVVLSKETKPDIAIVDYGLPDGNGALAAKGIREVSPDTRVIMLTGVVGDQVLIEAINAGCWGFVTKDKVVAELFEAVRVAHAGGAYIPPQALADLLPHLVSGRWGANAELSDREHEVLTLLAAGVKNQVIAERLVLSVHTVRNCTQRILEKMGAHSKLEAIAIATRRGLIDPLR